MRPTNLEFALLGLIRLHPQSGYELRKQFATTPMGHYSDSPGSIYPALARLARRGLIRTLGEERANPRKRRRYSLSPRGERELSRWLRIPLTRVDVRRNPGGVLLRFAFLAQRARPAEISRFLRSYLHELEKEIAQLESYLGREGATMPFFGRLALDHGLASYRAGVAWARRALKQIARSSI